mmetsp:Transcript_83989/g.211783  ORF Transcript_83989/g.211783 Transcript_83989/m.211783 type:complete len:204 (+) Transcript_83989:958-1569(+)
MGALHVWPIEVCEENAAVIPLLRLQVHHRVLQLPALQVLEQAVSVDDLLHQVHHRRITPKVHLPAQKRVVLNTVLVLDSPLQILNPKHSFRPSRIVLVGCPEMGGKGLAVIPTRPCPWIEMEEHEGVDDTLRFSLRQFLIHGEIVGSISHCQQFERIAVHQIFHGGRQHCEFFEAESLVSDVLFKVLDEEAGHLRLEHLCSGG